MFPHFATCLLVACGSESGSTNESDNSSNNNNADNNSSNQNTNNETSNQNTTTNTNEGEYGSFIFDDTTFAIGEDDSNIQTSVGNGDLGMAVIMNNDIPY